MHGAACVSFVVVTADKQRIFWFFGLVCMCVRCSQTRRLSQNADAMYERTGPRYALLVCMAFFLFQLFIYFSKCFRSIRGFRNFFFACIRVSRASTALPFVACVPFTNIFIVLFLRAADETIKVSILFCLLMSLTLFACLLSFYQNYIGKVNKRTQQISSWRFASHFAF